MEGGRVAAMAAATAAAGAADAAAEGRHEGGEWGVPSRATSARWDGRAAASDARTKSEKGDCIFETPREFFATILVSNYVEVAKGLS